MTAPSSTGDDRSVTDPAAQRSSSLECATLVACPGCIMAAPQLHHCGSIYADSVPAARLPAAWPLALWICCPAACWSAAAASAASGNLAEGTRTLFGSLLVRPLEVAADATLPGGSCSAHRALGVVHAASFSLVEASLTGLWRLSSNALAIRTHVCVRN